MQTALDILVTANQLSSIVLPILIDIVIIIGIVYVYKNWGKKK